MSENNNSDTIFWKLLYSLIHYLREISTENDLQYQNRHGLKKIEKEIVTAFWKIKFVKTKIQNVKKNS